jgi:hypothetical protein
MFNTANECPHRVNKRGEEGFSWPTGGSGMHVAPQFNLNPLNLDSSSKGQPSHVTPNSHRRRILRRVSTIAYTGFGRKQLLPLLLCFQHLPLCFYRCFAASAPGPSPLNIYTWLPSEKIKKTDSSRCSSPALRSPLPMPPSPLSSS